MISELPCAKYYDDGTIEIFGNKQGYPRMTAVSPAPDLNHTLEERKLKHQKAIDGIILQGYFVSSQKMIRNRAFDKLNQKTTLQLKYRPCMNNEEMEQTMIKIREILRRVGDR